MGIKACWSTSRKTEKIIIVKVNINSLYDKIVFKKNQHTSLPSQNNDRKGPWSTCHRVFVEGNDWLSKSIILWSTMPNYITPSSKQ